MDDLAFLSRQLSVFFVIVVYQFHAIKFIFPYLLLCKQGSNPLGAKVIRLDVQMKGERE